MKEYIYKIKFPVDNKILYIFQF